MNSFLLIYKKTVITSVTIVIFFEEHERTKYTILNIQPKNKISNLFGHILFLCLILCCDSSML